MNLSQDTKSKLRAEVIELKRNSKDLRLRLSLMYSLFKWTMTESGIRKMGVRKLTVEQFSKGLDVNQIKKIYRDISGTLSQGNLSASTPTRHENIVVRKLSEITRLVPYQSVWMGNRCIDIFIDGITQVKLSSRGKQMAGFAIEVDGPPHKYEVKQIKDSIKEDLLELIGIPVMKIENHEVNLQSAFERWEMTFRFLSIDTRTRRRLWLKIGLLTIFMNWPIEDLKALFQFDFDEAESLLILLEHNV